MSFDSSLRENHEQAHDRIAELAFGAYIGGKNQFSDNTSAPTNPAIGEPIIDVADCGTSEVTAAIDAATDAFEREWSELSTSDRASLIREWMDTLRDNVEELALLLSLEVGKPLAFARADIENGIDFFEYYADVSVAQEGSYLPTGDDSHAYIRKEPYGVTGQILPWNYPILLMGWKVGAALAAGNTTVVKPASPAPLTVIRAAQLSRDILPDGVLNVVPGSGSAVGDPLVNSPSVRKISFTGSVPVGQQIMRTAADTVTPVTLELGGKNPFIVFPDADIETAVSDIATGGMYNAGQSCDSAKRILVHEDQKEEFLDAYLDELEGWQPGDPLASGTTMGPLAYDEHRQSVREYVELGIDEGATLMCGGETPDGKQFDSGAYFEPTLLDDVESDMRIAQEEVFGPVQFLMTYESYEEAIEIANDVEFGLTAGLATTDPSVAHTAAADIEAGSIWVNQYFGTVPGTPFGGYKHSGIGRECAKQALDEHTQTKAVNLAIDDISF